MSELADRLRGKFIVLDGPDGSGKSTQLALLAEHLRRGGAAVEAVHDPGTTAVGEKIRAILLDRDHPELAPGCEVMLFMASRASSPPPSPTRALRASTRRRSSPSPGWRSPAPGPT
jgi:thymidylate kinase